MAEVLVAVPIDLLRSKEHAEAICLALRMGAVVYLPADGLSDAYQPIAYCTALEQAMPGVLVTFQARTSMGGPRRLLGHERLRFELRDGAL